MKHIIALLVCIILIPALILGGIGAAVYFTFFNPTPSEYPLLHTLADVESVEYAYVKLVDGELQGIGRGYVEDVDAFMADFLAIDCYDGLSLDAINEIVNEEATIDGFIINYADGSYEIVSIYISANSTLKVDSIFNLFGQKFYSFDQDSFKSLIDNYKVDHDHNDTPSIVS